MVLFSLALSLAWAAPPVLPWDVKALYRAPKILEAPPQAEAGVRALFYEGMPYRGKPTRVFAYYGAPQGSGKFPAMVLIHGGGGTAFAEWVRMWNKRGYAAIAMDTVGTRPAAAAADKRWNPERTRDEFSGPAGWGDFDNVDEPAADQWPYHAVAAAVLAHSLIRTFPEVDARRIGVTGISWGGYLTSIVSGVDNRFRFAAPVYGCGFLGEDSAWLPQFAKLGEQRARKWLDYWDPSRYLGRARLPMLWVNGTNDFAYPLVSWQKSYRLTHGPRTLAVRVRMKHSHPDGAVPEEIFTYADSMLRKGGRPARVTAQGTASGRTWVRFSSTRAPAKAEINFTRDTGKWQDRKWETAAAGLDVKAHRAEAAIPEGAHAYFINLIDERGLVVSSEHSTQ